MCNMKSFLYLQLLFTASFSLPVNPNKRSISASDPANLLEKHIEESPISTLGSTTTTQKPEENLTAFKNKTEKPIVPLNEHLTVFVNDGYYKIRIPTLNKPSNEETLQPSQVRIGLPFYPTETHTIKVSEPYIISESDDRLGRVIDVKEPNFNTAAHFGGSFFSGSTTSTPKPEENPSVFENKTEKPLALLNEPFSVSVNNDYFKIRVLDLTKPSKEDSLQPSQVRIGFPTYPMETHIIKIPEPYIIRVPHVIVVKEPHFINTDHFGISSFPGSFQPFGEFPTITPSFPSGENIFDISQIYPSNPIEISQGFEGFAPISGVSEIQGFPGFGDISQGVEIWRPEQIPTTGITDEKIDHETDSVIIDAKENFKSNKEEKVANEKIYDARDKNASNKNVANKS